MPLLKHKLFPSASGSNRLAQQHIGLMEIMNIIQRLSPTQSGSGSTYGTHGGSKQQKDDRAVLVMLVSCGLRRPMILPQTW